MATAVPLPRQDALPEGVIFHREHPAEPRIVLQIPDALNPREESETYVINLENPVHDAWFGALKNQQELRDMLLMEMHVAFCPRTGHVQPLNDIDAPSPIAFAFAAAHYFGAPAQASGVDKYFSRKHAEAKAASIQARNSGLPAPMSALRRMLGGR